MKEFKENIRWLLRFYQPMKRRFYFLVLWSVLVAFFAALIPYLYINIIDAIEENLSISFILKSVSLLLALGIVHFIISVIAGTMRARTNIELEWHFRQQTFAKLISLDQAFYDKFRIGDVVTRLTDDVGRKLSWFACSGIFRAWLSVLRIIFCLAVMFYVNPKLTLIAITPFPFQIILHFKSARVLQTRFRSLQDIISRVNETIETCFSGIRIVQAYNMENRQTLKFATVAEERVNAEISAEKAHIFLHSLYAYFWQIGQVLVLAAGGWMVINGDLTIGEFVAFDYYILYLVWPMFDIGGLLVGYRRAAVSIKRLRELDMFLPRITSPAAPEKSKNGTGRFVFSDVSFKRGKKLVLDSIDIDVNDHRMIAVVGEVGSGKSSLLSLICRFFDPDAGAVKMDGIPLQNWSLADLRKRVGYVSQEPLLFTETVTNNIRFGRDHISDDKISWAAHISQLTEEVNHFPEGFDTSIGLRGMTVSGGQKQRISIARALAGDPVVLVLDDATAHLDAETEAELWDNIYDVLPKMRIFVVSHRTATLERADIILVLKKGQLVEQGQHHELMERKGEYHRIYSRRKLEEAMVR